MPLLFRHTLRSLLKSPGFTLVAILTLSISIGTSTTVYSVFGALACLLPSMCASRIDPIEALRTE